MEQLTALTIRLNISEANKLRLLAARCKCRTTADYVLALIREHLAAEEKKDQGR